MSEPLKIKLVMAVVVAVPAVILGMLVADTISLRRLNAKVADLYVSQNLHAKALNQIYDYALISGNTLTLTLTNVTISTNAMMSRPPTITIVPAVTNGFATNWLYWSSPTNSGDGWIPLKKKQPDRKSLLVAR